MPRGRGCSRVSGHGSVWSRTALRLLAVLTICPEETLQLKLTSSKSSAILSRSSSATVSPQSCAKRSRQNMPTKSPCSTTTSARPFSGALNLVIQYACSFNRRSASSRKVKCAGLAQLSFPLGSQSELWQILLWVLTERRAVCVMPWNATLKRRRGFKSCATPTPTSESSRPFHLQCPRGSASTLTTAPCRSRTLSLMHSLSKMAR
mmetsp:Transcript_28395/g.23831  ORF Transcript_28395/g.23831 Transcript_28395/m.23831 type:complete len:206 (+) Transcript_28395:601-1218(+)